MQSTRCVIAQGFFFHAVTAVGYATLKVHISMELISGYKQFRLNGMMAEAKLIFIVVMVTLTFSWKIRNSYGDPDDI